MIPLVLCWEEAIGDGVEGGDPLGVYCYYPDRNNIGLDWCRSRVMVRSGYILDIFLEGDLLGFPDVGYDRET